MRIRVNAHSGLKQKEILTCYTWMNFEDIMLSDKSVTKGHRLYDSSSKCHFCFFFLAKLHDFSFLTRD